jgi:Meiotically up-regulated gene 113
MKLTAGEIYFIGERDLKTNQESDYVKIGIVREGAKGPRTSEERLDEHQTGNPRQLFLHEVIETPAVEELETRIHRIFAPKGVSGEWFQFSKEDLATAIQQAKNLRDEAVANLDALNKAEELKTIPSNGIIAPATVEAKKWQSAYIAADVIIKEAKRLKDEFEVLILESVDDEDDISHIVTTQTRAGATYFDEERFIAENPELAKKFMVTKTSWSQRFTVKNPKASKPDLFDIDPTVFELFDDFGRMLEISPESDEDREILHAKFLDIVSVESKAIWDKQIAEARLKELCAEGEGVEGVCGWPRTAKEREILDLTTLMESAEPIYTKYLSSKESTSAVIVGTRKGY